MGINIRPYQAADRISVFQIAGDTAFFGKPVEEFMEDRLLYCDAFYRFYTDLEPEHGWVACSSDKVVGFLMGCTDTASRGKRWATRILPSVIWNLLKGRYRIGILTMQYVSGLTRANLRQEVAHADLTAFPAHLHVNVNADWQGQGMGRQLIEAFLLQLKSADIVGVHLLTTSLNIRACRLYEKLGFELLDTRRTHLWEALSGQAIENRCYGLRLD